MSHWLFVQALVAAAFTKLSFFLFFTTSLLLLLFLFLGHPTFLHSSTLCVFTSFFSYSPPSLEKASIVSVCLSALTQLAPLLSSRVSLSSQPMSLARRRKTELSGRQRTAAERRTESWLAVAEEQWKLKCPRVTEKNGGRKKGEEDQVSDAFNNARGGKRPTIEANMLVQGHRYRAVSMWRRCIKKVGLRETGKNGDYAWGIHGSDIAALRYSVE